MDSEVKILEVLDVMESKGALSAWIGVFWDRDNNKSPKWQYRYETRGNYTGILGSHENRCFYVIVSNHTTNWTISNSLTWS
ncbi:hypothetical protein Pcinc_005121 [Petrolisthes cinctipes]|uniref:Uncharacterized protein n=1 Tax=Petrolisthes cinctipes TaxID=88211 RepID=A0AAE1GDE5_PETCI|nr:hypothetical protein Pcinc_005121 [Petrolisthes cinctipes]